VASRSYSRFGDQQEPGAHRRDRLRPKLVPLPAVTPGPREHLAQHQHRHVAAHAVALLGDGAQLVDHRRARLGPAVVELQRVVPGREKRVAPVLDVPIGAAHEPLRVRLGPGVVEPEVVRHEVEKQADPALRQPRPQVRQSLRTAELVRDAVPGDGVRRGADLLVGPAGQRIVVSPPEPVVGERPGSGPRPAGPDTHHPEVVEAQSGEPLDLRVGHVAQAAAELGQPYAGVDLEDVGMLGHRPAV
jgi:hypothetical protein